MAGKKYYFSNYIDELEITTEPNQISDEDTYRYSICIPFRDRDQLNGRTAVVIMKNPSRAGKPEVVETEDGIKKATGRKLSDETIYRVLDYLHKHPTEFSRVIILNLFPLYASVLTEESKGEANKEDENTDIKGLNLRQLLTDKTKISQNNKVIEKTIKGLKNGDRIIAAWGKYPPLKEFRPEYRNRIDTVMGLLYEREVWRVGNILLEGKFRFPQHGSKWVDYEEM